jgi:hypothetical protein
VLRVLLLLLLLALLLLALLLLLLLAPLMLEPVISSPGEWLILFSGAIFLLLLLLLLSLRSGESREATDSAGSDKLDCRKFTTFWLLRRPVLFFFMDSVFSMPAASTCSCWIHLDWMLRISSSVAMFLLSHVCVLASFLSPAVMKIVDTLGQIHTSRKR